MEAEREDYYNLLGVENNATPDEIKRAYRKKAREYHPDVNRTDPNAEERFKEIGEAYDVLSNPEKRTMYDRFGHDVPKAGGFSGYDMNMSGGGFGFDLSDILGGFFDTAAASGRRTDFSGDTLRYDISITLKQAYEGTIFTLDLSRLATCAECDGTGSATKSSPETCAECGGSGQIKRVTSSILGLQMMSTAPCNACNGSGQKVKDPCPNCHGQGRKRATEKLEVKIPAGVDTGSKIRYPGKGDAGTRNSRAGDLFVVINVKSHTDYNRDGIDLLRRVDVPYSVMVLGGKIELEHLDGEVFECDIPANSKNGSKIRLRGRGMPEINSSHFGDLHLITAVSVPRDLSKRERELLTAFAKERGEQVNDAGFFQKVKDLLE